MVKKHLFIVSSDDITRLSSWYQIRKNTYPSDLKCKNSLRFLYEGNLVECEDYLNKSKYRDKTKLHNVIFKRYHEKLQLKVISFAIEELYYR